MISFEHASSVCDAYLKSLVDSDVEGVMALYADDATVEDPVGTPMKSGVAALREFYTVACQSVTQAEMRGAPRLAGNEVAFPFQITIGTGQQAMVMEIIDVFRFNDEGKVVAMRAFWGKENMRPAN